MRLHPKACLETRRLPARGGASAAPWIFALVAALAAALGAAHRAHAAAPLTDREARYGELTRTWKQFDPPGPQPPTAIVVLLHGNGGSAAQLVGDATRATPHGRWLEIATRERLLLLVPDGTPGSTGARGFNDCRADASTNPDVDDTGWLASLLERTRAQVGRVPAFAAGFSNGGNMALRLAIERPELVLGVAAVAAAMPARSECAAPQRAVNVVLMNGTADAVLPFEGGLVAVGGAPRGTVLSTPQSLEVWTRLLGTREALETRPLPDLDPGDGSDVVRSVHRGAEGCEAVLYRINGGGHTAPSRIVRMPAPAKQNGDIEMADQIWSDFKRFLGATLVAGALAAVPAAQAADAPSASQAATPRASESLAAQLRSTRILVVGGTGRNGSAIVAALEAAGAKPRVLARDVAKARERFPGEREWVQGDVTQLESLRAAVRDVDVIINAVATTQMEGPNGVEAVDLGGMRNLLAAARGTRVKRMVFITGMTVGRDETSWAPPMRKGFGAKREAEKLLIASGLEYTILRPTGILPRPGNTWAIGIYDQKTYQPSSAELRMRAPGELPPADAPPPEGTIARADLAEVAIVSAVDPRAKNRVFVISHGQGRASPDWVAQLERMPRE